VSLFTIPATGTATGAAIEVKAEEKATTATKNFGYMMKDI
jgi:hypothetical protein